MDGADGTSSILGESIAKIEIVKMRRKLWRKVFGRWW